MARIPLTIFIFYLFCNPLYAQFTLGQSQDERLYNRAMELYQSGKYSPARSMFEEYIEQYPLGTNTTEANYYKTMAAMRVGHADAIVLADQYMANNSAYEGEMSRGIGIFYFDKKDYVKAADYFQKTSISNGEDELIFKSGYSYYKANQEESALRQFKRLKDGRSSYANDAAYYAGFILFNQGKYNEALPFINKVAQEQAYASKVKPLLADIYFKQGNTAMLANMAVEMKENSPNAHQVYLLTGEMYFLQKDYKEAIRYFEMGLKKIKSKDAPLSYKLGYSYENTGNETKAIENYKQAALGKDSTGQYASYRLGKLYVDQKNLTFAASSFYNASRMDFVPNVKRDALLQYGKANFGAAKYKEAIDAFTEYTAKYPSDAGTKEANELISKAFLQTSNYDLAIEYIEKLPNKTPLIKETFQRICFLRGSQVFNQSQFFQSVSYFDKSLEYPVDKELVAAAHYWKGEAFSVGKQYDDAIKAYTASVGRDVRSSYGHKSQYGIGYAHYNAKRYREALPFFQRFVSNDGNNAITKEMLQDGTIRLADCFFAEKQYDKAIAQYQAVANANENQRDYALYQLGLAYQLSNQGEAALAQFNALIRNYPKSVYVDDAYFQSAQVDFESGNYTGAVSKFSEVISQFPTSNLTPYAYIRRAIAYSNLKNLDRTEQDYIALITKFPTHPMANSAILGLQEVMNANGKSGNFEAYLEAYKKANPQSTNLETLDFEAAKSQYFAQNYQNAINRIGELLRKNPQSTYKEEANYYLADAYFRLGNNAKALEAYYMLLANPTNTFYLRSVGRVAALELAQKDYPKAIRYFNVLKNMARSSRDKTDAYQGLMEAHFLSAQYDSATFYANQIVLTGGSSFGAQSKANLYLGKAAFAKKNYDEAMDHYINTINIAKDEAGAEAQYGMAQIFFIRKNHRQSIQTLYDLNNNYAVYEIWLGRSFLLIADNFIELKEYLQAQATLNSLIEKSPNEDIKKEARAKKAKLDKLSAESITIKKDSVN